MTTFTKRVDSHLLSNAAEVEVEGLEMLRRCAAAATEKNSDCRVCVPRVTSCSKDEIVMEKIIPCRGSDLQAVFGESLALMHNIAPHEICGGKIQEGFFGWHQTNLIGANIQKNTPTKNWGEFFYNRRLMEQVNQLRPENLRSNWMSRMEALKTALVEFMNAHQPTPSCCHGDLWAGNMITGSSGSSSGRSGPAPHLIDPAFYVGDRLTDIAMTKMFGGFSSSFYRAYEEGAEFPLPPNADQLLDIYVLFHTLNHVNLFGSGYLGSAERILDCMEKNFKR